MSIVDWEILRDSFIEWQAERALDALTEADQAAGEAWHAEHGIPRVVFAETHPDGTVSFWWAGQRIGGVGEDRLAEVGLLVPMESA